MTLANLPVNRFAESLERRGELTAYETLLKDNFNPATLSGLMCRSLISVSWDGYLYDCDFNQMLEMPLEGAGEPLSLWSVDSFEDVIGRNIRTAKHCFGCTAGAGSSCGGALSAA